MVLSLVWFAGATPDKMQSQALSELHGLRHQNVDIRPHLRLLCVVLGIGLVVAKHRVPDLAAAQERLHCDLVDCLGCLLCARDDGCLQPSLRKPRKEPSEIRNGRRSLVIPGLAPSEDVQQHWCRRDLLAERRQELLEARVAGAPPAFLEMHLPNHFPVAAVPRICALDARQLIEVKAPVSETTCFAA